MKLQIIVGSTRPERVSDRVAKWVAKAAAQLSDSEVEIVDLADYNLPFFNETMSPQFNPNRQSVPSVRRWLDKLSQADAYVLVTPEYNRSYSAVLKNALDFIDFQISQKPVALVAHGTTGGAQAVAHLRGVLAGLRSFTTPSATYLLGRAGDLLDETGEIKNEEIKNSKMGPQAALANTLNELKWYADALSAARAQKEAAYA